MIDKWANFLMNEKLEPKRVPEHTMTLIRLCEELAKKGGPKIRPYAKRLESRRLVVQTAMDLGIDLTAMKHHGKMAMARSLLDAWNLEYQRRFESTVGTPGGKEAKRRNIKTVMAQHRMKV